MVETAKVLAEARGVTFEEIARQTTDNFFRLFRESAARGGRGRMTLRFTILGCGSSGGVPRPGTRLGRVRPEQSERTAGGAARSWSSAAAAATSPAS